MQTDCTMFTHAYCKSVDSLLIVTLPTTCMSTGLVQWRPQDLREGGAKIFASEARAQNVSHAPQNVDYTYN